MLGTLSFVFQQTTKATEFKHPNLKSGKAKKEEKFKKTAHTNKKSKLEEKKKGASGKQ